MQEKGGGLEEDRRWLASWITSAGQSGNGSTWGRGGTQWLLSLLEFWSVGLKRENEWGRQQKYNKSYSLTVCVSVCMQRKHLTNYVYLYTNLGATEDLSFLTEKGRRSPGARLQKILNSLTDEQLRTM